jgi:hypothetical protein
MFKPPMHPREQVKCFGDMRKNDHHETSSTKDLQEDPGSLFPRERDDGTTKQHAQWHQRDQCFKQRDVHSVACANWDSILAAMRASRQHYARTHGCAEHHCVQLLATKGCGKRREVIALRRQPSYRLGRNRLCNEDDLRSGTDFQQLDSSFNTAHLWYHDTEESASSRRSVTAAFIRPERFVSFKPA